jgi:hypothetical protein
VVCGESGIQNQIRGIQHRPVLEQRMETDRERFDVTDVRGTLETPNGALREQSAPQLAVPAHSESTEQGRRGEDRGNGYRTYGHDLHLTSGQGQTRQDREIGQGW